MRTQLVGMLLAAALVWTPAAVTQEQIRPPEADKDKPGAPLLEQLGQIHFPITTASKEAHRFFDQGLLLAYAFNHPEAVRSFKEAIRHDPECAMAYWGIALALGPNINAPMSEQAAPEAWRALQKAREYAPKASKREQDYIEALSSRYEDEVRHDHRPKLDMAYANAMREVSKRYPDDLDAATLFAEALMDTMPWMYWTPEGKAKPGTIELLAKLESVLARNPHHTGANHYYIHAVEAGPTPENGLPMAHRLEDLASGSGHLVHMPSHIYLKVGLYHRSSMINERAIKADEVYLTACRRQGFYPAMYYPHNIHFLWYSTAMEGRSADALAAARKVSDYVSRCRPDAMEVPRQNPVPVLTLARFKRWDEVLQELQPGERARFERGLFHYSRGLAFAAKNQLEDASKEKAALEKLLADPESKSLDTIYLPATTVLAIADHELAGALAARRGDTEGMIKHYQAAVRTQDELPYMEPPYYHYPVRQSLGFALLEAKRPAEAETVFREDLQK
ncbi:MAG: hypothetical protein EOP84_11860, partial [Verrucomicrobiaceae bacterium]